MIKKNICLLITSAMLSTVLCAETQQALKNTPIQYKPFKVKPMTHKPGERTVRPDKVTILDIRSNKTRYDEDEKATTKVTVINKSSNAVTGKLVATMYVDLDTKRQIKQLNTTLQPGKTNTWKVSYSVGPETYGRAIEVRFVDENDQVLDSWKEFYVVAKEFLRVQQHSGNQSMKYYKATPWLTYNNFGHYFANEPTDFGAQVTDVEKHLSGQALYRISTKPKKARIAWMKKKYGTKCTFYVNSFFCGQMGYEQIRKHPDYILYGDNGQPLVCAVYGGCPNPMELASPVEIGEKRKVKPYLDRKLTAWHHTEANLALEKVVVYQANCVKKYAKAFGFEGVYWDGNPSVGKGYSYNGKLNVPSNKDADYASLSARNFTIFQSILKKDNPNFATWYQSGNVRGLTKSIARGRKGALGMGVPGSYSDETIKAATSFKNVMFIAEIRHQFHGRGVYAIPGVHFETMCDNRDHFIQKYESNIMYGYMFPKYSWDEPGPTRWAWTAMNYFTSQFLATQMHMMIICTPSIRPTLQFMTRYSRYLWARDIKIVPNPEKIIKVETPEKFWWKRLVYKRKTETGYDLIIHFVRIPPTEKWDIDLMDDPLPLEGVKITADIGKGKVTKAVAMRPYYYEEEEQPVETVLKPNIVNGKVVIDVPSFKFHQMIVLRIEDKN